MAYTLKDSIKAITEKLDQLLELQNRQVGMINYLPKSRWLPPSDRMVLTESELAAELNVPLRRIRFLSEKGLLPCIRIGDLRRYERNMVLEALRGSRTTRRQPSSSRSSRAHHGRRCNER